MIADFLKQLSHEMGSLDNVVIAFTADHGIPPTVDVANGWKLEAGRVDAKALVEKLNSRLGPALGISGHNEWIVGARLFHFFLNRPLIEEKKLDLARVEREAKKILMEDPGSELIFSSEDFENGRFPPGVVGQQLKNGYVSGQSGDLFLVLKPFYYEKGSNLVTHMTGWSYDRSVPLILVGRPFKPGVYAGAAVVDLAPTLSFLLGALPPAKN